MDSDWIKLAWMGTLCVIAFALDPPIHRLSRAVENWTKAISSTCILPETIPPKPEHPNARLQWVIDPRGKP